MTGGFNNPIIGGDGALVYPSIHSPNFSPGPPITGWSIDKNGNAFFSGTIGGLTFEITSAGAFFYNGTPASGNLVASIASSSGTDAFSNHYNAGITSYDNTFGGVTNLLGAILTLFSGVTKRALLSPAHFTILNSHGATIYDIDLALAAQFLYTDTGSSAQGALVSSQAQNSGTDQFGNAYKAGFAVYSATSVISVNAGDISLATTGANASVLPATITVATSATGQSLTLGSGKGPEAGAASSTLSLGDSGSTTPPGLHVIDAADGNTYATERLSLHITADQTINSTSPATIGANSKPLQFPLAASKTYRFHAQVEWVQGATQAQQAFRFTGAGGLVVANMRIRVAQVQQTGAGGAGDPVFSSTLTALGADTPAIGASGFAGGAVINTDFDGVLTTGATGGTLELQARCVTSNLDTFVIHSWSLAEIMPE